MPSIPLCATVVFYALTSAAQETGSVEGVCRRHSGGALPGASVTLRANNALRDQALRAVTGEEGRFRFTGLAAGDYEFGCEMAGFVRFRQWVKVGSGTTKVDAAMLRGAVLAGRVIFGAGQTAAGIPVEACRRGGRPRYIAYTDPAGAFRFDTLPPARYLISAGGRGASFRKDRAYRMPAAPSADQTAAGWAPTFFPAVLTSAEAEPIPLRAGAAVESLQLRLLPGPVFSIRGRAVDDRGDPLAGVRIELYGPDAWFGPEDECRSGADGSFAFAGVRAGDWTVRGVVSQGGLTRKGLEPVTVSRSGADHVRLQLDPPFALSGFVERDEPRDAEGQRKTSAIILQQENGPGGIGPVFHRQDGSFVFPAVYPGRYRIYPLGFVPGWYLDSVRLGETPALKDFVDLRPGSPPIRIVYKPQAGRVRGTVERGEGAQVVLLPADETLWDGQFIRMAKAGAGGQFEVGSLRPGDYLAFAFEEPQDTDELSDPVLVRRLLSHGVRVTARHGELADVNLRVTPGGIW